MTLLPSCISQRPTIYCTLSLSHLSPPESQPLSSFFFHFFFLQTSILPPTYLSFYSAWPRPLLFPICCPPPFLKEPRLSCLELHHCSPFFMIFFRHPLLVMSHWLSAADPVPPVPLCPPRASVSQQAVKQHSQDPLPSLSITLDLHHAVYSDPLRLPLPPPPPHN